jgi:hypothetical protein
VFEGLNLSPRLSCLALTGALFGIMFKPMEREADYKNFEATALFCPRCKMATPVRKRLLLVLPDAEKYEYLCAQCGHSVGDKIEKGDQGVHLIIR